MSPQALLEVRHLDVAYATREGPTPAVRDVSFTLERGETLGFAGESGCGKTTLANAIMRLLPRDATVSGEVLLRGEDILTMKPGRLRAMRWGDVAIVFQGAMHSFNPVQRVGQQIAEALLIHGESSEAKAKARVAELVELVKLPARRAAAYPHELSGGQKQRMMIAMALACRPEVLIADEPTTALDVMVQAQVLQLLADLQRDLGLAMIFISHDLSVLTDVCARIAVMYAGRIVEDGPARDLMARPAHPYAKALARAFPRIGDPAARKAPAGLGGEPPDPLRMPAGCAFQPRCDVATEGCLWSPPPLVTVGRGRHAACILVPEVPEVHDG